MKELFSKTFAAIVLLKENKISILRRFYDLHDVWEGLKKSKELGTDLILELLKLGKSDSKSKNYELI